MPILVVSLNDIIDSCGYIHDRSVRGLLASREGRIGARIVKRDVSRKRVDVIDLSDLDGPQNGSSRSVLEESVFHNISPLA